MISKKIFLALCALIAFSLAISFLVFFSESIKDLAFEISAKTITLNDNGLVFNLSTRVNSVSELLEENRLKLGDYDQITPDQDAKIYAGTQVEIQRASKIKILVDGET